MREQKFADFVEKKKRYMPSNCIPLGENNTEGSFALYVSLNITGSKIKNQSAKRKTVKETRSTERTTAKNIMLRIGAGKESKTTKTAKSYLMLTVESVRVAVSQTQSSLQSIMFFLMVTLREGIIVAPAVLGFIGRLFERGVLLVTNFFATTAILGAPKMAAYVLIKKVQRLSLRRVQASAWKCPLPWKKQGNDIVPSAWKHAAAIIRWRGKRSELT